MPPCVASTFFISVEKAILFFSLFLADQDVLEAILSFLPVRQHFSPQDGYLKEVEWSQIGPFIPGMFLNWLLLCGHSLLAIVVQGFFVE